MTVEGRITRGLPAVLEFCIIIIEVIKTHINANIQIHIIKLKADSNSMVYLQWLGEAACSLMTFPCTRVHHVPLSLTLHGLMDCMEGGEVTILDTFKFAIRIKIIQIDQSIKKSFIQRATLL